MPGVLYVRSGGVWVAVPGQPGPAGATGPTGPQGPVGVAPVNPIAWIRPVYVGAYGFKDYGAAFQVLRYGRQSGICYLNGLCTLTSTPPVPATFVNLPTTYYPSGQQLIYTLVGGGTTLGRIDITTAGAVQVQNANGTAIAINWFTLQCVWAAAYTNGIVSGCDPSYAGGSLTIAAGQVYQGSASGVVLANVSGQSLAGAIPSAGNVRVFALYWTNPTDTPTLGTAVAATEEAARQLLSTTTWAEVAMVDSSGVMTDRREWW